MKDKRIFVTVGTTQFDKLVETAASDEICQVLRRLGYTSMVIQVGRGQVQLPTKSLSNNSPAVSSYRFKDSIANDIAAADLIISHAGAGSVLESLSAGKSVVVVINQDLMDNHQLELAAHLRKLQHLVYCTCSTLLDTLSTADFSSLQPFTPGDPALFLSHLDQLVMSPGAHCWQPVVCYLTLTVAVAALSCLFPSVSVLTLVILCLVLVWLLCGKLNTA